MPGFRRLGHKLQHLLYTTSIACNINSHILWLVRNSVISVGDVMKIEIAKCLKKVALDISSSWWNFATLNRVSRSFKVLYLLNYMNKINLLRLSCWGWPHLLSKEFMCMMYHPITDRYEMHSINVTTSRLTKCMAAKRESIFSLH